MSTSYNEQVAMCGAWKEHTQLVANGRSRACCTIRELQTITEGSKGYGSIDVIDRYVGLEEVHGFEVWNAKRHYGQQDCRNEGHDKARSCGANETHDRYFLRQTFRGRVG